MAEMHMGGVNPWKQIELLLARFEQDKKATRAAIRERFGSKAGRLRISGSWWCCRYRGRVHRGMTAEQLLERLAETAGRPRDERP